jgi:hypothetical protein
VDEQREIDLERVGDPLRGDDRRRLPAALIEALPVPMRQVFLRPQATPVAALLFHTRNPSVTRRPLLTRRIMGVGGTVRANPEQKNYVEIERLERLLGELRASASTARETEAIREIGFEIALAVREVGAMLVNVGWEQSYAAGPQGGRTES